MHLFFSLNSELNLNFCAQSASAAVGLVLLSSYERLTVVALTTFFDSKLRLAVMASKTDCCHELSVLNSLNSELGLNFFAQSASAAGGLGLLSSYERLTIVALTAFCDSQLRLAVMASKTDCCLELFLFEF